MSKKIIPALLLILISLQVFSQVEEEDEEVLAYEGNILDTTQTFSRTVDFSGEIHLRGLGSEGNLPFWMHNNQRGRVSQNSNVASWFTGKGIWFIGEETFLEAGAGLLYDDGADGEVQPDELYVHFETQWLRLTLGKKQRPLKYNGISASNENILWSLNAQPLPGIKLGTNGPVFLNGNTGPGIELEWEEYFLGEDRYMEGARLHHKSAYFLFRTMNELEIKIGGRHFANYGGTNPEGQKPELTRSYLDAITLKHPSQHHITSYEIYLSKIFRDFRLEFLYNHMAVDQSGRRLKNIPDGRYGLFFETLDKDRFIHSLMYEFYHTKNQSKSSSGYIDNYFNHFQYRSGWAYQDRIIGVPFFTYDEDADRVINNKFTAHHFGVGGQFSSLDKIYPYKILLSYTENEGTYENSFDPEPQVLSTYADMRIFEGFMQLNFQLAADFNSVATPNFGAGFHLRKEF